MTKTNSIFSSERIDLDSKEKEREVFKRRANRKKEELKTDIQGLPYLMIVGTLILTLTFIYFGVSNIFYALPLFALSIAGSFLLRKVNMPLQKKAGVMKALVMVFMVGLVVAMFGAVNF